MTLLLASCGYVRITRTPMTSVAYRNQGPAQARGVVVLLPGFGDRPQAFEKHGFVAALAKAQPALDIVAADAHFGYYRKRSIILRLEQDVIGPLRARGYREIWLAGTSMGGIGAIGYAREHPERVRGLFLLAPYLGPGEVVNEVAAQGLCSYDGKPDAKDSLDNFARRNFVWLRRQACGEASADGHKLSLYVGVGSEDRLRRPDNVLGSVIPAAHFVVLPGGHGWKVWTAALRKLAATAFDSPEVRY